jgi:hypothetical protein
MPTTMQHQQLSIHLPNGMYQDSTVQLLTKVTATGGMTTGGTTREVGTIGGQAVTLLLV